MEKDRSVLKQTAHVAPKRYSISEVSELSGISAFTIRYYDKCGFFPGLQRGKNNVRWFSEDDIAALHLVDALRKSGLSIEGIQYYVRLSSKGDASRQERLMILEARQTVLEYQREELDESLRTLQCEYAGLKEEKEGISDSQT
ncbi:MerR family transcriptional regulator [Raoultibacter phocaeensis]|uniref:MerR family transcriptional regulator n=1 Tax=Raoultibacter phocaeensis TaxID=2479841 RepID=UPI001118CD88|nr:MerR family transcriptional regulator [Raoultibacter phocaeensis]